MKKLCANKGTNPKRVHPSPPHPPLSILPAALLALASALSAEDQEVLAYLLGAEKPPNDNDDNNNNNKNKNKKQQQQNKKKPSSSNKQQLVNNHPPHLGCSCFGCYKSFWARWDASPNRHVIHLIIDAFEEKEAINLKKLKGKTTSSSSRKKRSSKKINEDDDVMVNTDQMIKVADDQKLAHDAHAHAHDDGDEVEEEGKSSVSRFVSWVFGINN